MKLIYLRCLCTAGFFAAFVSVTGCKGMGNSDSNSAAASSAPATCSFSGQVLHAGDSVTAYQSATVAFGQTCVSEQRTCDSAGHLSGSYTATSCTVAAPASCTLDGSTIPHGETVPAYKDKTVPFGGSCQSEERTCNNGTLSGSYAYSSCTIEPAAACTFNGQSVPNTGTVTAFRSATVPYGQTCVSETRTCSNGVLSGSYSFSSCQVDAPLACTFNGQTLASGSGIIAYSTSDVPYGQTCSSQTRTCTNGVLSGTYAYASCHADPPANCVFNGQTVLHTASIVAYADQTIGYGQSCASYAQTRTCQNGVLSGWAPFSSCAVFPNPPLSRTADLIEVVQDLSAIYTSGSDGINFTVGPVVTNNRFGIFSSRGVDQMWFADVDGDGRVDMIYRQLDNNNFMGLALGSGLGMWNGFTATMANGDDLYFADVDGDGRAEMISLNRGSGFMGIYGLGFSTTGFYITYKGGYGPIGPNDEVYFGDVNGDGKADLIVIDHQSSQPYIYIAWSYGAGFSYATGSRVPFSPNWKVIGIVDENSDGGADLVYLNAPDSTVGISIGNGGWGFTPDPSRIAVPAGADLYLADVLGYGRPSLIWRDRSQSSTPNIGLAYSSGHYFQQYGTAGPVGNNANLYFGNTK
jgi:hypothetical protein